MNKIRDFAFVDAPRIRSYYQQIVAPKDLLKEHKCPSWKASLSIAGPKAEGSQTVSLREATIYEEIEDVEKHLHDVDLVTDMRNADDFWEKRNRNAFFVKDVTSGRRALISTGKEAEKLGVSRLGLWILDPVTMPPIFPGHSPDRLFRGFLIESCSESDSPDVPGASGFTALEFMLYALETEMKQYRFALLGDNELPPRKYPNQEGADERFLRFANDPAMYLEGLGAHICPTKRIETLFRSRFIFDEDGYHDRGPHGVMSIVGYPLYIVNQT